MGGRRGRAQAVPPLRAAAGRTEARCISGGPSHDWQGARTNGAAPRFVTGTHLLHAASILGVAAPAKSGAAVVVVRACCSAARAACGRGAWRSPTRAPGASGSLTGARSPHGLEPATTAHPALTTQIQRALDATVANLPPQLPETAQRARTLKGSCLSCWKTVSRCSHACRATKALKKRLRPADQVCEAWRHAYLWYI